MAGYKLYVIDMSEVADLRVSGVVRLDCAREEDAIRLADRERAGAPAELWGRGQLVRSFKATGA